MAQYNNYQLISQKMYGKNWLLTGDAGGFLDPIFSSGLFLAIKGSFAAAEAISMGTDAAFKKYQKDQLYELSIWQKLVDTWYSGGLFTLFKVGQDRMDTAFGRFIGPHMQRHLNPYLLRRSRIQELQPCLFKLCSGPYDQLDEGRQAA